MKFSFGLLAALFSLSAFAGEKLVPLEDDMVPASLVMDVQNVRSKDGIVSASLVTVFRGSAAGLSSTIVTFSDSPETSSYSFEFGQLLGEPKNVKVAKKSAEVYHLSFDVKESFYDEDRGEFSSIAKTIRLAVTKVDEDAYQIERL